MGIPKFTETIISNIYLSSMELGIKQRGKSNDIFNRWASE